MSKSLSVTGVAGCLALLLAQTGTLWAGGQATPRQAASGAQGTNSAGLKVTLLGTGVGPPVNLDQFGASTLVEAGGKRLLFDCGRGATIRLTQAGIPTSSVNRVFLTHLHSDHVVQLPDLFLTAWVGAGGGRGGRTVPLDVWGPQGTRDMMSALETAFAFDIHIRRDVDEKFSAEGIRVRSHDIKEGVVLEEDGVKVTAFLVDHAPVWVPRRLWWPLGCPVRRHAAVRELDPSCGGSGCAHPRSIRRGCGPGSLHQLGRDGGRDRAPYNP